MSITIRVDQKLLRRAVGIRIWQRIKQARLLGVCFTSRLRAKDMKISVFGLGYVGTVSRSGPAIEATQWWV